MKSGNSIIFLFVLFWVVALSFGVSRLLPVVFDDSDAVPQTAATYKGGSLPSAGQSSSGTGLAVPAKLPQAGVGGLHGSRGVHTGVGRSYSAMPLRGSNMGSGRRLPSRSASSVARSYSVGGKSAIGGGSLLGSTSFGSTSGLRTGSSAILHSSGGGVMQSSASSLRGSHNRYAQSPVGSVGAIGPLQVPALAFGRSVNSLSSMQSNSAYSARSARYNVNPGSTYHLGGYSGARTAPALGGISDGYGIATMSRNFDALRRSSSSVDAAWRNAYIAEMGSTPSEDELQAYIAYYQSQGIFTPPYSKPSTPDPFDSGLGNLGDSWHDQYVSEFGSEPTPEQLQAYIDWKLGTGAYFNPNPEDPPSTPDPFDSGLGNLGDSWHDQYVSEFGSEPTPEQLQAYIDWKLGTGAYFNPNPEDPPSTPDPFASGLGNLDDSWLNQFISEMGRPPSSPEELQAFIDWKLTGLYYQNNAPIGDGIWLMLIFAMAMLVRRMAKKKQMVIDNKSLI